MKPQARITRFLVVAAVLVASATVGTVASIAAPAASPTDPHSWRCGSGDLGLDNDTVQLAPILRDDRRPDGGPVRMTPDSRDRYVPVIMVHGWTGSDSVTGPTDRSGAFSHLIDLSPIAGTSVSIDRSMLGQLQNLPGAAVFTFDYHPYSGRWVTDSHLGPALGRVVDCLYRASGEKVIVVGHSMGGLVARYAASQAGVTGPDRSGEISTAVTFGTPETGSLLAEVVNNELNGAVAGLDGTTIADIAAVIRLLLSSCGALATRDIETGSLCDELPAFARAFDSSAGQALRSGSSQLAALKPWPKNIIVDALAGNTTFQVPAGWFALPWHTRSVPVGDVIVEPDSATNGADLSRKASCAYQINPVRAATDQVGLWFQQVAKADVASAPLGAFSGACFHTSLMRDDVLTAEATSAVHDDIDGRAPVTAASLMSAPVPADCHHKSGVLVRGTLPGIPANQGDMELGWLFNTKTMPSLLALGDLNGDSGGDAAAVLDCNAGGVSWPNLVAFYTHGPTLLGYVDLGGITLPGHEAGENTNVYRITYDHVAVDARWATQENDDPAAIGSLDYEATLRWNGRSIAVSGLTAHTEKPTATAFIAAVHQHRISAADALASPGVAAQAETLATQYPAAFSTAPACYGVNNIDMPPSVTESETFAADRICTLSTGGDGGDLDIVFGMVHTGFNQWHVGFIDH